MDFKKRSEEVYYTQTCECGAVHGFAAPSISSLKVLDGMTYECCGTRENPIPAHTFQFSLKEATRAWSRHY